jgi:hypothetical protein
MKEHPDTGGHSMYKLIAALIAILAVGVAGAIINPRAIAQQGEAESVFQLRPRSGFHGHFGASEPGTWQIVTAERHTILLNTASGETFQLVTHDDELRWKAIPWPQHRRPAIILPRSESEE